MACSNRESVVAIEECGAETVVELDSGWPPLPTTQQAADTLVSAKTRRSESPGPNYPPTVDDITSKLASFPSEELVIGYDALSKLLEGRVKAARQGGRDLYILFGTHHDSGGQVRVFTQLVGPSGIDGLTEVTVEQLIADGRWEGIDRQLQQGDGQILRRALESRELDAWRQLARRQEQSNYTAWRYGYVREIIEMLASAQARSVTVLGCDMPLSLQRQVSGVSRESLDRLRELHCLLSLRDASRSEDSRAVAMFWGAEHVLPSKLRRFLPSEDEALSILLIGQRPNPLHLGGQLRERLTLNSPLLITLDGPLELFALLMPDSHLGGEVERSRTVETEGSLGNELEIVVDSSEPAVFITPTAHLDVGVTPVRLLLKRSHQDGLPYVLRSRSKVVVGQLDLERVIRIELSFSHEQRRTRVIYVTVPALRAQPASDS